MSNLISLPAGPLSQVLLHLNPQDWAALAQTCLTTSKCVTEGVASRMDYESEVNKIIAIAEPLLESAKAKSVPGTFASNYQIPHLDLQMWLLKKTRDSGKLQAPAAVTGEALTRFPSQQMLKVHKLTPILVERVLRALYEVGPVPFENMLKDTYPLLRRSIATVAREYQAVPRKEISLEQVLDLIRAECYEEAIEQVFGIQNTWEKECLSNVVCVALLKKKQWGLILKIVNRAEKDIGIEFIRDLLPSMIDCYQHAETEPELSHALELVIRVLKHVPFDKNNINFESFILTVFQKNQVGFLQGLLLKTHDTHNSLLFQLSLRIIEELGNRRMDNEMWELANAKIGELARELRTDSHNKKQKINELIENYVDTVTAVLESAGQPFEGQPLVSFLNGHIPNMEVHLHYMLCIARQALIKGEGNLAKFCLSSIVDPECLSEAFDSLAQVYLEVANAREAIPFIRCVLNEERQKMLSEQVIEQLISSKEYDQAIRQVRILFKPSMRSNRLIMIGQRMMSDNELIDPEQKMAELCMHIADIKSREKLARIYVIHQSQSLSNQNMDMKIVQIVTRMTTLENKEFVDLFLKNFILCLFQHYRLRIHSDTLQMFANFIEDGDMRKQILAVIHVGNDSAEEKAESNDEK